MDLKQAISLELKAARKGPQCATCKLLDSLPGDDKKTLMEALADPDIPHSVLELALTKMGYKASGSSISRHRKKLCLSQTS